MGIQPPDVDFVCVLKNIKFTENDQIEGNLTVRDGTPFVNAYITNEACAELWKDFLHEPSSSKQQLSSLKLKGKFRKNYSNVGNLFQPHFLHSSEHVQSQPERAAFTVETDEPQNFTPIIYTDSLRSLLHLSNHVRIRMKK